MDSSINQHKQKIKVGITQGDINGIGYEVIIKTLNDSRITDFCIPIVYGSPKLAAYHRKAIDVPNFSLTHIKQVEQANPKRPNIINCVNENTRIELGKASKLAGESAFMALDAAINDLKQGKIDAVVTAPINKKTINSEKFNFPGHTEYLQNNFNGTEPLMFMIGDEMKIGIVAGHVPIKDVAQTITTELILRKLRLVNNSLIQDFKQDKPTIAVLGLNPHAGDENLLGKEEQEIIIPALEQARKENIMALGPYASDGFFGSQAYRKFDAVLAMYHDQGLAPFKIIEFNRGVNFTAGLPIIRTSPVHGTAYEIAGKGIASAESFRNALFLAIEIYNNRQYYNELKNNTEVKQEEENEQ